MNQTMSQKPQLRPAAAPLCQNVNTTTLPSFKAVSHINFGCNSRSVQDVGYEDYLFMSDNMKQIYRKKCAQFNEKVKSEELENAHKKYLPLLNDNDMKAFLKISSKYDQYKDQPIICLGRSPKWFLNASLWKKDGIDDYKFVAFSKTWHRKNYGEMVRMNSMAPTKEEEQAYKKYLQRIQADPGSIVENMLKTGKKTVITDYVQTGKGACSFLDVMSKIAEEEGILEEFAKSIQIVAIGSMEYMERFYHDDEEISQPSVPMPERLMPYKRQIKQEFYDMPLSVFEQMLINENTNECRASFYPHESWTAYQPDRYKTGMISDKKIEKLQQDHPKSTVNFTPAMRDYRNLLNFRILDYLAQSGELKEDHRSKL